MNPDEKIARAFDRSRRALTLRPSIGQGTATTRLRMTEGLRCEIEDGRWNLQVDLSEKGGGEGSAPDPGVLGRSALASCLAIVYKEWSVHLGIPVSGIEVDVEADYDTRGEYGVADRPPGYDAVRFVVRLQTDATEEEVDRLRRTAEAHCAWLDDFRRALDVQGRVDVRRRSEEAS